MFGNIFDSHAHYDSRQFDKDRDEVLRNLQQNGVSGVMSVGADLASSARAQKLADEYDFIYFSAGIHPHEAKSADIDLEKKLAAFAQNPKMRAIGEIGLDYHYDHSPRDVQMDVFIRQVVAAKQLGLPVIIHNREAHEDTLNVLSKYKPSGVVHSYSGSVEMARELLKLGYYFGFAGMVTFKNARKPVEVVDFLPVDRILLETDCPYLAPEPYRGQRSDSTMISKTAEKIAEIKGLQVQELIDTACENAHRLFGI